MSTVTQEKTRPSLGERALAFVVMFALMGIFAFILISDDVELTTEELPIAIILLAILGLAAGTLLPALMNVRFQQGGLTIKAAGGAAMFVTILYFGFQAIGTPVPAGHAGQGTTAEAAPSESDLYMELLGTLYGNDWTQQTMSTAYSGCYANFGMGQQMVQSFWGTGASMEQAQTNAAFACNSVCVSLGGTCAPMS
jgi:hypothetical protein